MPYESEVYKKAHEAMVRMLSAMPSAKNLTLCFEFVYMNEEVYVFDSATRKSSSPWQRLYLESTGVSFEEALVKLQMDRFDFYVPDQPAYKKHVSYVAFFEKDGIIVKRCDYPTLKSKVTELFAAAIGHKARFAEKHEYRIDTLTIFMENEDYDQLVQETELLLNWEPFEYSTEIETAVTAESSV